MRLFIFAAGLAVGLTLSALVAAAWTGPTGAPPNNNAFAPINVGSTDQVKNANLGVNGLAVFGNTLLDGTNADGNGDGVNSYLNFGSLAGSSGYGIRDDNGTLQFSNEGGTWASIQSTVQALVSSSTSGQWSNGTSGAIYYNGGNVGIGMTTPSYPLQVKGSMYVSGSVYAGGTQQVYLCPVWLYTGAGNWASYGCIGQLTTQSTCTNIWNSGGDQSVSTSCTPVNLYVN